MSDKTFTENEVNEIVQKRLERDRSTRVVKEPRTYAPDSPHSFYADIYRSVANRDEVAQARKVAHAREVAHEIVSDSPEGRRAMKVLRNSFRAHDEASHIEAYDRALVEVRDLTTGGGGTAAAGGNAAALVSPYYLLGEWAPFRGRRRAFADQCHPLPLPAYGMHAYIPYFGSAPTAGLQTEGSAVTEGTWSAGLEGTEVQTASGRITISQQFLDRAFGAGGNIDAIVGLQLSQQVEEQVDLHALTQAIANGQAVESKIPAFKTGIKQAEWNGIAEGVLSFYADLAEAREKMTDEAGTRLRPTHFFTTSDFYSFMTRQSDGQGRPIIIPAQAQGVPIIPTAQGADDYDSGTTPKWSRFTGTILPGGVMWFTDDNIPIITKVGTNTGKYSQLVTSSPDEAIVLLEDDPVLSVFPGGSGAKTMDVVVVERKYCAAITRHAAGTVVTTGTSYTEALK